jgi:hypothetical protein
MCDIQYRHFRYTPLRALVMVIGGLPFSPIAAVRAVEGADAAAPSDATRVADAMWSSLQELHTGVCRVHWTYSGLKIKEAATYVVAFDFDRDLLRYDRRDEGARGRNHRIQEVRGPNERLLHVSGSHVVERLPPGEKIAVRHALPIDPRVVGLLDLRAFISGTTWRQLHDLLAGMEGPTAHTEAEPVVRIDWQRTDEMVARREGSSEKVKIVQRYRRTVWVDTSNGLTPIRCEQQATFDGQEPAGQTLPSLGETKWARNGSVYVPTECVMRDEATNAEGRLSFEWISVNGGVDDKAFTIEGLEVDPETLVVNKTLGPKIIEKTVNPRVTPGPESRHYVFIGGAAGLALIVIAWMAHARRGRSRALPPAP